MRLMLLQRTADMWALSAVKDLHFTVKVAVRPKSLPSSRITPLFTSASAMATATSPARWS